MNSEMGVRVVLFSAPNGRVVESLRFMASTIDGHPRFERLFLPRYWGEFDEAEAVRRCFIGFVEEKVVIFRSISHLTRNRFSISGRVLAITEERRRELIRMGYEEEDLHEIGGFRVLDNLMVWTIAYELLRSIREMRIRLLRQRIREISTDDDQDVISIVGEDEEEEEA